MFALHSFSSWVAVSELSPAIGEERLRHPPAVKASAGPQTCSPAGMETSLAVAPPVSPAVVDAETADIGALVLPDMAAGSPVLALLSEHARPILVAPQEQAGTREREDTGDTSSQDEVPSPPQSMAQVVVAVEDTGDASS